MVTDLVEVRRLGTAKQAENLEFRRYLAAHHHHEVEAFQALASEIQRHIDCTVCANCCRSSIVSVSQVEIETIARFLDMEPDEVARRYTAPQTDAPALRLLKSSPDACVFLEGNLCSIYSARPKACHDFPHLALGTHSLGGRISSLCRWAPLCPIVFNALEEYKHHVGFHAHRAQMAQACAAKAAGSGS